MDTSHISCVELNFHVAKLGYWASDVCGCPLLCACPAEKKDIGKESRAVRCLLHDDAGELNT
jgi:hypothetical protein